MTGFALDWLTLRADADARARDAGLLAQAADAASDGLVIDLGAGAGATMAAMAPLCAARWVLADNDAALLAAAADAARSLVATAETTLCDLDADLEALLARRPRLVAASAFFDLASAAFIARFAQAAAEAGAAVYAALTYDGRCAWAPPHAGDAEALAAFHRDMRRDKGLGPALGPEAADALARALAGVGYDVRRADSAWRLRRPRDAALIAEHARGIAAATRAGDRWRESRENAAEAIVGHLDILATPPK